MQQKQRPSRDTGMVISRSRALTTKISHLSVELFILMLPCNPVLLGVIALTHCTARGVSAAKELTL